MIQLVFILQVLISFENIMACSWKFEMESLSQGIKEAKSIPYLAEILDMINHNNNFVIEYAQIMKNESKNKRCQFKSFPSKIQYLKIP